MMSGLEIVGGAASTLQLASMIYSIGSRILDKPKDTLSLRLLSADARKYIVYLEEWERERAANVDVVNACRNLRERLEAVIVELEQLKGRTRLMKIATSLKLYKPEFREKLEDALEEFKFMMCIETQRSVDEMDENLGGMTRMMNDLHITSKTLQTIPGMDESINKVREKIADLSHDVEGATMAINRIRSSLEEFQSATMPEIQAAIITDGQTTREAINQSTVTVIEHLGNIESRLDTNESVIRLKTEILPKTSPLIWYDGSRPETKPRFRLWSLDDPASQMPGPNGVLGGLELSSFPLRHTYDETLSIRHIADDVDEDVREKKNHRTGVLDPYIGLAKKGDFLEELHEYVPSAIVQRFRNTLPYESQIEALRIVRTLSQEYRYFILNQILQTKAYSLPKLHILEDMERAMLALQAEKLNITLGFAMERTFRNVDFFHKFNVTITSVGYDISVENYDPETLNETDSSLYRTAKLEAIVWSQRQLRSLGREGLCALLRMFLPVVSNEHQHGAQSSAIETASNGVQTIFGGIFNDPTRGLRRAAESEIEFYATDETTFITRTGFDPLSLRKVGNLRWHECILKIPSSVLQYSGPELFSDYRISAANALVLSEDYEGARKLLNNAIARQTSASEALWLALASTYLEEEKDDQAIETFETAIRRHPGCFGDKFWFAWYDIYKNLGEYDAGTKRLELAMENKEGLCWKPLAMAYMAQGFQDKAISMLETVAKNYPELAAMCYAELDGIYVTWSEPVDWRRAIDACEKAVSLQPEVPTYWRELGNRYDCVGRHMEAIEALKTALCKGGNESPKFRAAVLRKLCQIYHAMGQSKTAIAMLEKECSKSEDVEVWLCLVEAHTAIGDYNSGIEVCRNAITRGIPMATRERTSFSNPMDFLQRLADLYQISGDLQQAKEVFKELVQMDPYDHYGLHKSTKASTECMIKEDGGLDESVNIVMKWDPSWSDALRKCRDVEVPNIKILDEND